jgi:hypothetical protein
LQSLLASHTSLLKFELFAREQKHSTTVFEVCLISIDQDNIALKVLLGTITD